LKRRPDLDGQTGSGAEVVIWSLAIDIASAEPPNLRAARASLLHPRDEQNGGSGIETQVTVGNVTVAPAA